jgi:lipopolysaccharide export LptBFGC system permease protein LptF
MMKNNKSIIKGHKVFYGDEYGDQRRIEWIERIDSIRGKIENIINEIFNKNELIYEAIIKNLSERIKEEDYEQIYEDANKLINFLEEKKLIEFAQNFSIYNEDIKSIISIYMNVTQTRNNTYKNI